MANEYDQTGMSIFLSIIAMVFVVGILVMAFVLSNAQIQSLDLSYTRTSGTTVPTEVHLMNGSIGYFDLSVSTYNSVLCTVNSIKNGSTVIGTGNYSVSNCRISNLTSTYNNTNWTTNYTYTYLAPNQVGEVLNDTTTALSSTTDWFSIIITISAVVVLILLIVLIILYLRGAGIMGGTGGA